MNINYWNHIESMEPNKYSQKTSCHFLTSLTLGQINNIDIDIWTPNPYQQSISVYHIMRHLFGSVLVKRSKIIVRSFLNLNSRRICQGMSEANTPSPSWRHGCWDFRSSHPILVAWLWRCTFRVYVFFSCFFFAQRHHIQIAQAVNSMAFSWHPDLNEVCVTCWNRIVRAMFLPCLSCVMTAQKNEVPYRLELLIPWARLVSYSTCVAWRKS